MTTESNSVQTTLDLANSAIASIDKLIACDWPSGRTVARLQSVKVTLTRVVADCMRMKATDLAREERERRAKRAEQRKGKSLFAEEVAP